MWQAVGTKKEYRWWRSIGIVGLLLLTIGVRASHIIGGDVSMQAVGKTPGLFRIQLNQYWDATKIGTGNQDATVTLLIFRKNNPILVEKLTINLQERTPLTFSNNACATAQQLSFIQGSYYVTHQFDITKYTDPGGYYMVWERCCRNDALTNVVTTTTAGVAMAFYIEFPPMTKSGVSFVNSSPEFVLPNGAYICLNKPFTFNLSATDADGDKLVYSLVTPLNGYTTKTSPLLTDESPKSSYPVIDWAPGYSLSKIIPGNPPLQINQNTGILNVKASQQGLYLFTVQCEEYRNGVRIGVVRRDFQLPVVDCVQAALDPAVIASNGATMPAITLCSNQPLVLSVEKDAKWAYQWQKDGLNLRGSTSDTIHAHESGLYTVVKSQANACASDTISQAVSVTFKEAPPVSLTIVEPQPYCTGMTLTLRANGQSDYSYRWQQDGKNLTATQPTVQVNQSGQYKVLVKSANGCDGSDSLRVTINPLPTAQISASSLTMCVGDSVTLSAVTGNGYTYAWQQNQARFSTSSAIVRATKAGTYQAVVTAPTGCTALSNSLMLNQVALPVIQLAALAPVCVAGTSVSLTAQPTSGTFVGEGVTGNQFNPAAAGVGTHEITYTVANASGCRASKSTPVQVTPTPTLSGQLVYYVAKGNSVKLLTRSDRPISTYAWTPPATLSQGNVDSPEATPTESTAYTLTATSTDGCASLLTVRVEVSTPLYIPSSFSPNSDGVNDTWILPNVNTFPDCEVSVFNRWGEVVFFSKGYAQPWDGTYQQQRVQAGIYTYQIRTGYDPLAIIYRGPLTVLP